MKYEFLFLSIFFLTSCSIKKESLKTHYTMKLQKAIFISFKDINKIDFKIDPLKHTNVRIKVLAVNHKKEKTKLFLKDINNSGSLSFLAPENPELYTYLVAIIKGIDENGHTISNVGTYKIGEQDQINKAKKYILNN